MHALSDVAEVVASNRELAEKAPSGVETAKGSGRGTSPQLPRRVKKATAAGPDSRTSSVDRSMDRSTSPQFFGSRSPEKRAAATGPDSRTSSVDRYATSDRVTTSGHVNLSAFVEISDYFDDSNENSVMDAETDPRTRSAGTARSIVQSKAPSSLRSLSTPRKSASPQNLVSFSGQSANQSPATESSIGLKVLAALESSGSSVKRRKRQSKQTVNLVGSSGSSPLVSTSARTSPSNIRRRTSPLSTKLSDRVSPTKTSGRVSPTKTSGRVSPDKTSGRVSPDKTSGRVSPTIIASQTSPNIEFNRTISKNSLYKLSSPDSHSQISALIEQQRQESIRELERLKQKLTGRYASPDAAAQKFIKTEVMEVTGHPYHVGIGVSAHIKAIENINRATQYYNHRHLRPYFLRFVQYFVSNYSRSRKCRKILRYQRRRQLLLHFNQWRRKQDAVIKYSNLYKFRGNISTNITDSRLLTLFLR